MVKGNFIDYLNDVLFDMVNVKRNESIHTKVLVRQVLFTGFEAFPVVLLLSLALGASVISMGYLILGSIGQSDWTYNILISAVIRDVGPIITAFIILLRSGTAITTEMGSMSYNGEIGFLKSLGISPVSYLVSPRIVGMVLSIILLMMYFASIGVLGGYLVSSFISPIPFSVFLRGLSQSMTIFDLLLMVAKVAFSGFVVGVICTFHGLRVERAITEVPQRNIKAVTQSITAVLVINVFFITSFFMAT